MAEVRLAEILVNQWVLQELAVLSIHQGISPWELSRLVIKLTTPLLQNQDRRVRWHAQQEDHP